MIVDKVWKLGPALGPANANAGMQRTQASSPQLCKSYIVPIVYRDSLIYLDLCGA